MPRFFGRMTVFRDCWDKVQQKSSKSLPAIEPLSDEWLLFDCIERIDVAARAVEMSAQSPKAGGLQPLELANAQPTQLKTVTRVGVEPTDHEGLSFAALPDCVPRRVVSL